MHFAALSLSTLLPFLLAAVVRAAPTAPVSDVVWAPKVIFPTAGTIWQSNTQQTIVWDATNAPADISNESLLFLRQDGFTAPFILAKDFDLRAGSLEITVPYVLTASNYQFVLFGDSGDFSPVFTIQSDTFNSTSLS